MKPRKSIQGILIMIASQLIFVSAWVAMKHAGGRIPLFEVLLFRGLFSLLLIVPLILIRKRSFRPKNWLIIFTRSLFGYIALAMFLHAMLNMEMGNATSLFNTLPIFVAILAPALLKEPFGKLQFIFILISFIGIAIILRPDSNIFEGAAIYALSAGIFAALAMISLRKLGSTDSPLVVTFYFTLFIIFLSLPMAVKDFIIPTHNEFMILAFAGISLGLAQVMMTSAYKLGTASSIAPFGYVFVIGSYFSGLFFFSEMPDKWSIIGAAIVIIGGVCIMLTSPKKQCVPGSTPGLKV
ncbi:MAG: DMT family transporter [Deltaproteobacteria bacterium]|jgi:drug/metabolite transporter (DMT)-like permease|nr:DMT family transporter [Deltaproteobacteria bacterium]